MLFLIFLKKNLENGQKLWKFVAPENMLLFILIVFLGGSIKEHAAASVGPFQRGACFPVSRSHVSG